jgi:hypothetical protein
MFGPNVSRLSRQSIFLPSPLQTCVADRPTESECGAFFPALPFSSRLRCSECNMDVVAFRFGGICTLSNRNLTT